MSSYRRDACVDGGLDAARGAHELTNATKQQATSSGICACLKCIGDELPAV